MRFHFLYVFYVLHRTHGRQGPTRVPEVGDQKSQVSHTYRRRPDLSLRGSTLLRQCTCTSGRGRNLLHPQFLLILWQGTVRANCRSSGTKFYPLFGDLVQHEVTQESSRKQNIRQVPCSMALESGEVTKLAAGIPTHQCTYTTTR